MQNRPGGALFRVGAAPAAAVGAAICRPGDSAMGMAGPFHPPFSFCTAAKRERAVDGPREKTPRRVGLRRRRPPAAGGGWLAVPCRSQGRKRPALGETSGPGKFGIPSASLPAAAHAPVKNSQRQRKEKLVHTTTTPSTSAVLARDSSWRNRRRPKRARRPGKIGACTDTPTPVARGGPLHRSALSAFFSSTGRGAFSFWARPKREWGAHPCGNSPLREQTPPWPPSGGPYASRSAPVGLILRESPPPGAPTPPGCLPRRIPCGAAHW